MDFLLSNILFQAASCKQLRCKDVKFAVTLLTDGHAHAFHVGLQWGERRFTLQDIHHRSIIQNVKTKNNNCWLILQHDCEVYISVFLRWIYFFTFARPGN